MTDRRARGDISLGTILNKRRAPRTLVRFDVQCVLGGASFEATARNLTPYGVFVETEETVPHGVSLELALHLPNDEGAPAKATVEVRRPARRRDERPGFGADFVALDDDTARRIAAVLEAARLAAPREADSL